MEALTRIDANRQGFIIVTDESCKVLGVLTDGDVRRAIVQGYIASESISAIYTKNAKTVSVHDGFEIVTELFKNESIIFFANR